MGIHRTWIYISGCKATDHPFEPGGVYCEPPSVMGNSENDKYTVEYGR